MSIVNEFDKLSRERTACSRHYHEVYGDFGRDVVTAFEAIAADIAVEEVQVREDSSTFWNAWKAFAESDVPTESR
jgi:hypothetical protein